MEIWWKRPKTWIGNEMSMQYRNSTVWHQDDIRLVIFDLMAPILRAVFYVLKEGKVEVKVLQEILKNDDPPRTSLLSYGPTTA
jgi:hypothetical protein